MSGYILCRGGYYEGEIVRETFPKFTLLDGSAPNLAIVKSPDIFSGFREINL